MGAGLVAPVVGAVVAAASVALERCAKDTDACDCSVIATVNAANPERCNRAMLHQLPAA
jgi:hypothetical protein